MGCDGERRLIFGGVCCRCGAIQIHEGMWVRLPGVVGVLKSFAVQVEGGVLEYEVSHGYCPTCQLEVILRWHKERRATVGVVG